MAGNMNDHFPTQTGRKIDRERTREKTLSNKNKSDSKAFYFDFYIYVSHWIICVTCAPALVRRRARIKVKITIRVVIVSFACNSKRSTFERERMNFCFRWHISEYGSGVHCINRWTVHLVCAVHVRSQANNILINRRTYYIDTLFATKDLYRFFVHLLFAAPYGVRSRDHQLWASAQSNWI